MRTALSDTERNARLNPTGGETKPAVEVIKSPRSAEGEPSKTLTINFAPNDLINCTYLTAPDEDGQRFRAKIIQKIVEHEDALEQEYLLKGRKPMKLLHIMTSIIFLQEEMSDTADQLWTFKDIIAHEGPLAPGDPS